MNFLIFLLRLTIILIVHAGNQSVYCGNDRPYWVSITGFQGAGSTGQDSGAGGYAGSSLVSPLASSGFNSPLARYSSGNSYQGNPSGASFGGYGGNKGGGRSASVAGGQGKLPYGSG